jgi:cytochrome P450
MAHKPAFSPNSALPIHLLANANLEVLEQLPYLNAFIKESLRLSYGVAGGLLRLSPNKEVTLAGLKIPPQTSIVTSIHTHHHTASLFPNPDAFNPSRWLPGSPGKEGENLDRNMVVFGTGSRMCLGKELALLEIYVVVSTLIMAFEVGLVGEKEWRWKERWAPVRVSESRIGLRRRK